MNSKFLVLCCVLFILGGILLGFSNLNDNPKSSILRKTITKTFSKTKSELQSSKLSNNGNKYGENQSAGIPYYTDNFDGANDTNALKSRGYLIYRNGVPSGIAPTWFQGNTVYFDSYNGPPTGYVSSNFASTASHGSIDNWLVLPKKNVGSGDVIKFRCRSVEGSPYPDSVKVMYSNVGDSTPSAGSWVQRGYFKVITDGTWELKSFSAPSAGANARWAIRYYVVNGGSEGTNSFVIGIDALNLETPAFANDIATTSINAPGNTALPAPLIAPKATFTNFGTANQTNIPVTYKITGPVNYTNNKTIASLSAGASVKVVFDSTFLPVAGTYNVTAYSSLGSDGDRSNDTLKTTFSVLQVNYGGGGLNSGGYYFANSTTGANAAPSKPIYNWVDTAGSISLVVNSIASVQPDSGNLDDGNWKLTGITGVKKIKFFGVSYSDVYVGTNGLICFTDFNPLNPNYDPPDGLPNPGPGGGCRPGIYPSWNDLNWENDELPVNNRLSYKVENTKNRLIITYDRAPIFGSNSGLNFAKFQVVIDLQSDTAGAPNSNITLNYDSSYNTINVPYMIGIQDPAGANWLQYAYYNEVGLVITPGPIFDGTAGVSLTFGPNPYTLGGSGKSLYLTDFIEGFWNFGVYRNDTITVLIRSTVSPYNRIDSAKGKTSGSGQILLHYKNVLNGVPYYIVVKGRNSLETWSKSGGVTWNSSVLVYNLTTAASQAFGNNLKLKDSKYTVYSGDVSGSSGTQDGSVNLTDVLAVYNDAAIFKFGYVRTDVNFDNIVDLSDIIITTNNSNIFVSVKKPA